MKHFGLMILTCLVSVQTGWAQRDFSDVEIKPQQISGNIYMLEGSGGNIGVSIGDDGILIVDDQYAPLADKIKKTLDSLHPGPLKFVLNTHHHGDHTGGNPIFGLEATIVAHSNVRKRISTGENAIEKSGWPVITYDQSLSVHFNGEEIQLIHYGQGHTDGDAIIYFTSSNVVHMGDTFFNGRYPYVDLNSNGSVAGLIQVISTVLSRIPPDVKVIPGHEKLGTKEDLRIYHAMLIETSDLVRSQMKEGKSLEEIQEAGLQKKWESWGRGSISTERWISFIYNSYTQK